MGGRGGKGISRDDKDDASREPPPPFFLTHTMKTLSDHEERENVRNIQWRLFTKLRVLIIQGKSFKQN